MIVLDKVYKVFGSQIDHALALAKEGIDKSEIFKNTGKTVGLADVSFSIELGKTFVVMGLSGSGKSTLLRLLNRLVTPSSGKMESLSVFAISKARGATNAATCA